MTYITINGSVIAAHQCQVCGARDTNPETLARHEQRHANISALLAGRLVMPPGAAFRRYRNSEPENGRPAHQCKDCGNQTERGRRRCRECMARLEANRIRPCVRCKQVRRIYAKDKCDYCYHHQWMRTRTKNTMSSTGVECKMGIRAL